MEQVDCVVIGAGVVGLACARALALAGREVLILESEAAFGSVTSARNSEVIHAGLPYPTGSLRARLCLRGKALLYELCASHGVAHRRCGKLVLAADEGELAALAALHQQAQRNGVHDLQWLSATQVSQLEPALHCQAALLSPSTGIIDSHALMLALLGEAQSLGAVLALRTPVLGGGSIGKALQLEIGGASPMSLRARSVINAAGLQSCALASQWRGLPAAQVPRPWFAKGVYFRLVRPAPFSHLVYPLPQASGHLGLHLTLDLAGQARFGPTFEWVEQPDYQVDNADAGAFEAAIRRYWPALPANALQADYAGVRPRISGPGEPAADFRIDGPGQHGVPGLVNLFGIESPGLTACLAIAELVTHLLSPG